MMTINNISPFVGGGNFGNYVDLTPYDGTGSNVYTTPCDGYIFINTYYGNNGFIVINGQVTMGCNFTTGNQQKADLCFIKAGMTLSVAQVTGSPSLRFYPFA